MNVLLPCVCVCEGNPLAKKNKFWGPFLLSLLIIIITIILAVPSSLPYTPHLHPPSPLALFSQIYSRAARSRLAQTFCRQRRDVTCARSLLRSERFPPPVFKII